MKISNVLILSLIIIALLLGCNKDKSSNPKEPSYSELIIGSWELVTWTEAGETFMELDEDEKFFYFIEYGTFISLEKKGDGSYENECYAGGGSGGSYTINETTLTQKCGDQWDVTMTYSFSNNNNTLTMKFSFGNLIDHEIVAQKVNDAPDYHNYLPN